MLVSTIEVVDSANKLLIWPARRAERYQAGRRLVRINLVEKSVTSRSKVGNAQTDVAEFAFQAQIELFDVAALLIQRIAFDALRRRRTGAGRREGARKLQQRPSRPDLLEERLANLEGAASYHIGVVSAV